MIRIIDFMILNNGYAQMKEIKKQNIKPKDIRKLVEKGEITKIKPGLYRLSNLEDTENFSITNIDVVKAVPHGVLCLMTALHYYELTTDISHDVHIAILRTRKRPTIYYPPVQEHFFSKSMLDFEVKTIDTKYGKVKIFSPEKTICDMFRLRNKFGEAVAIEALKSYVLLKEKDLFKLMRVASKCRVAKIINPYLEAIVN